MTTSNKPHPYAFLVDGDWWVTDRAAAWRWSHHPKVPPMTPMSQWLPDETRELCELKQSAASVAAAMIVRQDTLPSATFKNIEATGWSGVALHPRYSGLIYHGSSSDVAITVNRDGRRSPIVRVRDASKRLCAVIMPTTHVPAIDETGRFISLLAGAPGDFPQMCFDGGEE